MAPRCCSTAPPSLLPDQSNLTQHLQAIAGQVYLASLIVVPTNWNFFQFESRLISEVKQLNIKAKSINGRRLNQWPANTHAKGLEAALSIPKGKSGCEPYCKIEDSAALLPSPGLADTNQFTIECPGSERHVANSGLDRLDKFWCFAYWS